MRYEHCASERRPGTWFTQCALGWLSKNGSGPWARRFASYWMHVGGPSSQRHEDYRKGDRQARGSHCWRDLPGVLCWVRRAQQGRAKSRCADGHPTRWAHRWDRLCRQSSGTGALGTLAAASRSWATPLFPFCSSLFDIFTGKRQKLEDEVAIV